MHNQRKKKKAQEQSRWSKEGETQSQPERKQKHILRRTCGRPKNSVRNRKRWEKTKEHTEKYSRAGHSWSELELVALDRIYRRNLVEGLYFSKSSRVSGKNARQQVAKKIHGLLLRRQVMLVGVA